MTLKLGLVTIFCLKITRFFLASDVQTTNEKFTMNLSRKTRVFFYTEIKMIHREDHLEDERKVLTNQLTFVRNVFQFTRNI